MSRVRSDCLVMHPVLTLVGSIDALAHVHISLMICLCLMHVDEADLKAYIEHPEHEEVKRIQGPMVVGKFVVDIRRS